MKRQTTFYGLSITVIILIVVSIAVCCNARQKNYDVSGVNNENNLPGYISDVNEIVNLVTDDEKLVINYFDAYTWVVYTSADGSIERMTYIYKFNSAEEAQKMLKPRTQELSQNRSMTILRCNTFGEYVVVELKDSSFNNVNRSLLETNFAGLVIH